jgi:hypothetical protein
MNEQSVQEKQRRDLLLATIYLFSQHGRDKEVSRSEVVDCMIVVQNEIPLGYEFHDRFAYCFDFSEDLQSLQYDEWYIDRYTYGRRTLGSRRFWPKNFISLRPLGRGHAKKIIEDLDPKTIEVLNRAIEVAIDNYRKRWGVDAR